jgi:hypothetical protein
MAMKPRSLKVEDDEWKAWHKKAEQAGIGLSEWIRSRCNDVQETSGMAGTAAVAETEKPRDNRADTPVHRTSPVEARQVAPKPKSKKLELAEAVAARNPGHKVGCQCFQCVQIERFIRQQRKE